MKPAWHIITGEYPPSPGGVSDYTYAVAGGLATAGDAVHVWCPEAPGGPRPQRGVDVHALAGAWSTADLHALDRALDATPAPRRLLVQWVPHAFGKRSMNVRVCRWIRGRARTGDTLDLMVHEPGLGFGDGALRHDFAAAVHRLMLTILLSRADRVWITIPAWEDLLRPWALGRDITFDWLPVPSTLPIADPAPSVRRDGTDVIVGHFSTYQPAILDALERLLPSLLAAAPEVRIDLLGRGGHEAAERLSAALGDNARRVTASGELDPERLSRRLQACDLVVQPYPDGASTRRTTLMAAMAHGLPIVTTIGRLSEPFWRTSDAILAVPAGDYEAMAHMAADLARRPQRRHDLGAVARATYDARFSLARAVDALRAEPCGVAC